MTRLGSSFRSHNQYLMLSPSKHCLYVDPKDLGFKLKPVWPPDEDVSGLRGNPGTVKSLPQSPEKKESWNAVGMLVETGQSWDPFSKDTVVFSPDDSPRLIGMFGQHFRIDEFSGTDEVRTVFSMDTDPPPIRFPGKMSWSDFHSFRKIQHCCEIGFFHERRKTCRDPILRPS